MSTQKPAKKQPTELEKELKQLDKQLHILNARMRKMSSLRFRFFSAVVQGFGVALGGTIVAYIVITIVVETLRQINYIPIINMIFDSEYFSIFVDRLINLQTELK